MLEFYTTIFAPPRDLIPLVIMFYIGTSLAEQRTARHNLPAELFSKFLYYATAAFLLTGGYETISLNPTSYLPQLNLSLFNLPLGLVASALVGVYYFSNKLLPIWNTLDALTYVFSFTAIGIALAHLASGQAFGMATSHPWAIEQWGALRHPTQLYELLASLVIPGILWFRKTDSPPGAFFLHFTALTAGARLFLEAFRGDSTLVFGEFRLAQIVAWTVLAFVLFRIESQQ